MLNSHSLRTKIVLVASITMVLLLSTSIGFSLWRTNQATLAGAERETSTATQLIVMSLNSYLSQRSGDVDVLSTRRVLQDAASTPEMKNVVLKEVLASYKGVYSDLLLVDAAGKLVTGVGSGTFRNSYADAEWFSEVKKKQEKHI